MKKDKLIQLSINEIEENIIKTKKNIILMRVDKKTKQKVKPHEIKKEKHLLAQLLTLKRLKIK